MHQYRLAHHATNRTDDGDTFAPRPVDYHLDRTFGVRPGVIPLHPRMEARLIEVEDGCTTNDQARELEGKDPAAIISLDCELGGVGGRTLVVVDAMLSVEVEEG